MSKKTEAAFSGYQSLKKVLDTQKNCKAHFTLVYVVSNFTKTTVCRVDRHTIQKLQ